MPRRGSRAPGKVDQEGQRTHRDRCRSSPATGNPSATARAFIQTWGELAELVDPPRRRYPRSHELTDEQFDRTSSPPPTAPSGSPTHSEAAREGARSGRCCARSDHGPRCAPGSAWPCTHRSPEPPPPVALIAAGIVLLLLAGVGVCGLLAGPRTSTAPQDRSLGRLTTARRQWRPTAAAGSTVPAFGRSRTRPSRRLLSRGTPGWGWPLDYTSAILGR